MCMQECVCVYARMCMCVCKNVQLCVCLWFLLLPPLIRFIMEEVDLVIVGAEGVAESGGIINKVQSNKCTHVCACIYLSEI